jgi:tetratricopeptide (TPR) repeat protein
MPTRHRVTALSNWGFNCTCALCSSPPDARAASDSRRETLVDIYHALNDPSTSYEAAVEMTRDFIDIVRVERLEANLAEYYQVFMKTYYDFGDIESALRYAQIALVYAETFSDPEGGFCTGLRQDLELLERLVEEGADR